DHLRADEDYDEREDELNQLKRDCFIQQKKFAMSDFTAEDAPGNKAIAFGNGTEHQQGQEEEEENEANAALLSRFAIPHPWRRKNQQERFENRAENDQERLAHAGSRRKGTRCCDRDATIIVFWTIISGNTKSPERIIHNIDSL